MRPLGDIPTRFWPKVDKRGPNECWEWRASRRTHGYGQFGVKRNGVWKADHAHRVAWELVHGPIPEGMCVLHHCDNPPCCNPAHLFLGTMRDNTADMLSKGRGAGMRFHALKTHCPRGHAYDEANTRVYRGRRHCRACDRERGNGRRKRRHFHLPPAM